MPKAKAPTPSKSSQTLFFVLTDGKKRVLVPRPKSYQAAIATALRHFPHFKAPLTLQTDELDVCGGNLTDISSDIWEAAVDMFSTVLVKEEPAPVKALASAPAAPPALARATQAASSEHEKNKHRVTVNSETGEALTFLVKPTTPLGKVFSTALGKFMIALSCHDDYRFTNDDTWLRVGRDDTPASLDYAPGEELSFSVFRAQRGGKPVIYLFSPDIIDASVSLTLTREWELSVVYPVVPAKPAVGGGETIQWSVRTHPDGSLTERSTGLDVAYLFWEALTNRGIPISPPGSPVLGQPLGEAFSPITCDLSPANSVLLTVSNMTPYLDQALQALGLHTEARTSFITYWLPSFLKHTHVALRFVPQAAYEAVARLDITPAPDVVTRVFMVFKGVAEENLGEWHSSLSTEDPKQWKEVVDINVERALDATLFRVLEWGGMEVLGR